MKGNNYKSDTSAETNQTKSSTKGQEYKHWSFLSSNSRTSRNFKKIIVLSSNSWVWSYMFGLCFIGFSFCGPYFLIVQFTSLLWIFLHYLFLSFFVLLTQINSLHFTYIKVAIIWQKDVWLCAPCNWSYWTIEKVW
jgi:hypothetical protein